MAAPLARLCVAAGRHTPVSTDRLATRLPSRSNFHSIGPAAVRRWMSDDFAGRKAAAEALKVEEEGKTAAEARRKSKAEADAAERKNKAEADAAERKNKAEADAAERKNKAEEAKEEAKLKNKAEADAAERKNKAEEAKEETKLKYKAEADAAEEAKEEVKRKIKAEADAAEEVKRKNKAEADKSRAEADAAKEAKPDLLRKRKAEADKAEAEAEKSKAEAGKRKAEAEKIKAEAGKRKAEAEKIKAEADAAIVTTMKKWRREVVFGRLGSVVLVGTVAYLAWDHYAHTNRDYLRKQMREAILKGLPETLPEEPINSIPVPPLNASSAVPTVLLGPSGSGKSTLLANYARELKKQGVPVVYFRLRGNDTLDDVALKNSGQPQPATSGVYPQPADGSPPSPRASIAEFTVASERFFRAVGYPLRPSWLSILGLNIKKLSAGGMDLELTAPLVEGRFTEAVSDLFVVCSELARERNRDDSIPSERKQPVIFADELHDLLDKGVAEIGGTVVFRRFANGMVLAGVDGDGTRVRVFVSGSNPQLSEKLAKFSKAGGNRVEILFPAEPSPEIVVKCLRDLGYPETEARQILNECGTRLRLLTKFLEVKKKDGKIYMLNSGVPMDVPANLNTVAYNADQGIAKIFWQTPLSGDMWEHLVKFLDNLATSPSALSVSAELAVVLALPHVSKVIFCRGYGDYIFQTEAYRLSWQRLREKYLRKS